MSLCPVFKPNRPLIRPLMLRRTESPESGLDRPYRRLPRPFLGAFPRPPTSHPRESGSAQKGNQDAYPDLSPAPAWARTRIRLIRSMPLRIPAPYAPALRPTPRHAVRLPLPMRPTHEQESALSNETQRNLTTPTLPLPYPYTL